MAYGSVRKPGAANFLNDSTGTFTGTVAQLNNACDLIGDADEANAINDITLAVGTASDTIANFANFAQGMADENAVANALNANLLPPLRNALQTITTKLNSLLAANRTFNVIAE